MKVLLIKTPYLNIYGSLKDAARGYFPMGLGYIASVLKNSGFEVMMLDPEANLMSENAIRAVIKSFSPSVIGISCSTPNIYEARDLAKIVRQESSATIVLGGAHASSLPVLTLKQFSDFDLVVYGEGELTMLELCQTLKAGKQQMHKIKGIAYRANGGILVNEARPWISDLDQLSFPERSLLDISLYRPQTNMERGKKSAVIITSRGCPFKCTFCASYHTAGRIFRSHSPQYVISEMEYLIKNYGIEYFLIQDDEFTIDPQRTRKICQMIIERKLRIEWWCHSRVDTVTEELLSLMRKAGCVHISYGVESGNETILKSYRKGISLEQSRCTLKISNRLGLKTHCFFILGHINETKQTIKETIRFAIELAPTMSSFAMLVPYPGTEEFEKAKLDLRDINIWKNFVTISGVPVISSNGLSRKMLQAHLAKAYIYFYLRPIQLMRILKNLSSFEELKAYIRGGFALLHQIVNWIKG